VLANDKLIAAIETDQELRSNRLRDGKNFDAFITILLHIKIYLKLLALK